MIFQARAYRWDFEQIAPLLMGVINLAPDSFSDGGETFEPEAALEKAKAFQRMGADILDLGAESSRPGSRAVSPEEELKRLIPALELIRGQVNLPISVDTTKSVVAREALERGASIINDVSGLKEDAEMARVIAHYDAGVVLMHRRGNAQSMQSFANYQDLISEVLAELKESIDTALKAGISYQQIAIDPGIGFSKTKEHNLSIIKHLEDFKPFERPLLVGTSRKSFLGEITGRDVKERLWATAASVALSVERGANIIRVHDVGAMKDVIQVTEAILKAD